MHVPFFHRFSVSPLFRHQAATASTPDLALIATHPLHVSALAAAVAVAVAVAVVASVAVSKTRRHTEEDYMAL